jgi:arylsulfatase A-like enzyme
VDYSEFTPEQKRKVRAHYAALIQQIDVEVGEILTTLAEQGLLENTVILFASDHGDYLGDHDLIGKGAFYEGSTHIPLIVRPPGGRAARTVDHLVTLTDVTATLLAWAGLTPPAYMDARPLPGLGLPGSKSRQAVVGMTASGWMIFDGVWKLAKYATGDLHLFNLAEDPQEQHNRVRDPACAERYLALDVQLTQAIMQAIVAANADKALDTGNSWWGDPDYGKQGWQRAYPNGVKR